MKKRPIVWAYRGGSCDRHGGQVAMRYVRGESGPGVCVQCAHESAKASAAEPLTADQAAREAIAEAIAPRPETTPGTVPSGPAPVVAPAGVSSGDGSAGVVRQPLGVTPCSALAEAATGAARALARLAGALGRGDTAQAATEARRASLELATVAVRLEVSK